MSTEHKYTVGNDIVITQRSNNTQDTHYLHKDGLGSVVAITGSSGAVVSQYFYSPFGEQHQIFQASPFSQYLLSPVTDKGFTGHNTLKGVGIVHMKGRIYDPVIGRFLQADPFVQSIKNPQNYNRYSYVLNNPLSYTDPSGYFFDKLFKKLNKMLGKFAPFVAIAVTFIPGINVMAAGFIAGGIATGSLKGAIVGAISAGMFNAVGTAMPDWGMGKIFAHGMVGGMSSVMGGGKFEHGFLSAGITQAVAPGIDGIDDGSRFSAGRVVAAATVGGTVSVISGGKFANGAMTGAFSRAFNDEAHHQMSRKQCVIKGGGCNFEVSYNPNADGGEPIYELDSFSKVGEFEDSIEFSSKLIGTDADLVKSIMYMETTHGYYDSLLSPFDLNKSILPMNINHSYWGDSFGTRAYLNSTHNNIWAGAKMISSIQANMPGASIAQIATVYNNVNATTVSNYGARVANIYRNKPWKK